MSKADAFGGSEWRTLQFVPLWTFQVVSRADTQIDDEESHAVVDVLFSKLDYPSELACEILKSIADDFQGTSQRFMGDERKSLDGIAEAAGLLEQKVTPEEAKSFKDAMLDVGRKVAEAAGKFEDAEKEALAKVASALKA